MSCHIISYCIVSYRIVLYCIVSYYIVLYCIVLLCCVVLCCIVLYCAVADFGEGPRGLPPLPPSPLPPLLLWNICKRFTRKRLKWAFKSHFKGFWAPLFLKFYKLLLLGLLFKKFLDPPLLRCVVLCSCCVVLCYYKAVQPTRHPWCVNWILANWETLAECKN